MRRFTALQLRGFHGLLAQAAASSTWDGWHQRYFGDGIWGNPPLLGCR